MASSGKPAKTALPNKRQLDTLYFYADSKGGEVFGPATLKELIERIDSKTPAVYGAISNDTLVYKAGEPSEDGVQRFGSAMLLKAQNA